MDVWMYGWLDEGISEKFKPERQLLCRELQNFPSVFAEINFQLSILN